MKFLVVLSMFVAVALAENDAQNEQQESTVRDKRGLLGLGAYPAIIPHAYPSAVAYGGHVIAHAPAVKYVAPIPAVKYIAPVPAVKYIQPAILPYSKLAYPSYGYGYGLGYGHYGHGYGYLH